MNLMFLLDAQALWVLVFWTIIGVVIFSSCVYFTEKLECPVMLNDEVDPEFVKSSKSVMEYAEFIAASAGWNNMDSGFFLSPNIDISASL